MESDGAQSPSDASDAPYRRRGRPIGKNRVPLSLKERRARNAQYEKERRQETSEAMAELADAAKCDPRLNNSDLLATVINHLKEAAEIDSKKEIEELKRTNEKLIRQVEALEQRLSNWEDHHIYEDDEIPSMGSKRKKCNERKKSAKKLKSSTGGPLDNLISAFAALHTVLYLPHPYSKCSHYFNQQTCLSCVIRSGRLSGFQIFTNQIMGKPCKVNENINTKKCECHETDKRNQRNYYRYYDTPDGCDVLKKVLVTSRYGAMAGLMLSTYDVLMYSHAIGFGPIMRRYAYHTIPLALMGATFAGVSNSVLRMREEDDLLNYFIGGVACGPILRMYLGTNHALVLGSLALGVIAMIKKDSITSGYQLLPNPPTHLRPVNHWRADYTYIEDPKDTLIHTCGEQK